MSEKLSAFDLLEDDYQGRGLHKLQETLEGMKGAIRHRMDQGLSNEDFQVAQRVLVAVETGEEAANSLHDKMVG